MKKGLTNPNELDANSALKNFIGFCQETYPAKHYILLLLGHGLIVGNDNFLPDDSDDSSITLKQLGLTLKRFATDVKKTGDTFELLALHSCSMSALEVSYELKGTARYMMSSEGLSFVGTWPYRQLFKKTFSNLEEFDAAKSQAMANNPKEDFAEQEELNASKLIEKLYYLSLFGTRDFAVAGYSLDLCLSSLDKDKVIAIKEPLQKLVAQLRKAVKLSKDGKPANPRAKELVVLAHLESQSYWQEDYTDFVDFCLCLQRLCLADIEAAENSGVDTKLQDKIAKACATLIDLFLPCDDPATQFNKLIVHSDNFGFRYQYSHGLSVYFPWAQPLGDVKKSIMNNYEKYAFHTEFDKGRSWLSFLNDYFAGTMRRTRQAEEEEAAPSTETVVRSTAVAANSGSGQGTADPFGSLSDDPGKSSPAVGDPGKSSPSIGFGCGCPSIKNYPAQQTAVKGTKKLVRTFAETKGVQEARRCINGGSAE
jgi:hypothetical protein